MSTPKRKIKDQKYQIIKSISVKFHSSVLQSIRQHAKSSPNMEICGVLIGKTSGGVTMVDGAVAGEGATQGNTHVTFTQQTWIKIHREKNERFPDLSIVGWYHSHPGFGVFLSDHDLFIHNNFFADPGHLAWVYDPHSDEEGCFCWFNGQVCRLQHFEVIADIADRGMPQVEHATVMTKKQPLTVRQVFSMQSIKQHLALILISIGVMLVIILIFFVYPKTYTDSNAEEAAAKSAKVSPQTPLKGTDTAETKENEKNKLKKN